MPRPSRYELASPSGVRDDQQLARLLNELRMGRLNVVGEVTVEPYTDETVIRDARFASGTIIVAMVARDEDSAGLFWWLKAIDRGRITLGHDDDAVARSYLFVALG